MADFEWYLNRQGARGQKGEKGDTGEAVSIEVVADTANEYILKFVSASGETVTPNLRGTLIDTAEEGTYVRYNPETQEVYTSDIEMASTTTTGAVRFTTEEELLDSDSGVVVSPSDIQDYLFSKLQQGNNVTINKDEVSGNITISSTGGGSGGTSDYNELTNKPQINSVELTGNKTLDDLDIQRKFNAITPLGFETISLSNYIGDISCDEEKNKVTYKSPTNALTISSVFTYKGNVSALYGNAMLPDGCLKFPISTDILYIGYANGIVFAKTNPDGSFTPKIAIKNNYCGIIGNWYQTLSTNTHYYSSTSVLATSSYDNNTPYGAYRLLYNEGIPTLYCCFNSRIYSYQLASSEALSALEDSDCIIIIPRFASNRTQNYGDLNSSTYNFGARTLTSEIAILPTYDNKDTLGYYYPSISLTDSFSLQVSTATTSRLGVVKPDGSTITIDSNGTISAPVQGVTLDTAQTITGAKTFDTTVIINDDIVTANNKRIANGGITGEVRLGDTSAKTTIYSSEDIAVRIGTETETYLITKDELDNTIDGTWTKSSLSVANSVSPTGTITYDLSDYLPNDNNIYEIICSTFLNTDSNQGARLTVYLSTDLVSNLLMGDVKANAAANVVFSQTSTIIVGQNRQISLSFNNTAGVYSLILYAYRKVR